MVTLNDFLKAQVELANSKQVFISAENNFEIAIADFNTLLRRPVDTPVELVDIQKYSPFEHDFDYCLNEAKKRCLELKASDIKVKIAKAELKLADKAFFPSINIEGNYYQSGKDWRMEDKTLETSDTWDVTVTASWELWSWGKTYFGRKEKLHNFIQSKYKRDKFLDGIYFEIKKAWLKVDEADKNITTARESVKQAKENFRIQKEKYKERVATSTEVLDAQILLSKTMTNYYNALYDFQISKAILERTVGLEAIEDEFVGSK
eukprot:CAMPEP_0201284494 /NCGR_PEP_ID=MMETSP1317-20130820/76021_1 /ASSEMBLY_ACC=CAM_ASM_000770 /TAXON_ID=187299 /ORGANISM="Undescribed Undescribed, Strain Undescribed" /LENGTH=262 /DNA_ID=CAMNT_0047604909 /DNA_START=30 /DNA_END=818 /DNA_ORIENTATION=+